MIGGACMRVNKFFLLLTIASLFHFSFSWAQDVLPNSSTIHSSAKMIHSLFGSRMSDTITVSIKLPAAFKEVGVNRIIDPQQVLSPILEQLRLQQTASVEDTLRIVHIGDSHIRGHIYPQTTATRLTETFHAVSYTDMGVNGATCLTFTHHQRVAAIAALKPELLILSFGTNESHNRNYQPNAHYHQMDELLALLRERLPTVPILLTTPPGSYESQRRRYRRRTYTVNPRTDTAATLIVKYAADRQLAVWDLYNVVGGKQRACKNWQEAQLMRPDHVHYMPEGYILQGELLYEAIVKAYNDYLFYES